MLYAPFYHPNSVTSQVSGNSRQFYAVRMAFAWRSNGGCGREGGFGVGGGGETSLSLCFFLLFFFFFLLGPGCVV